MFKIIRSLFKKDTKLLEENIKMKKYLIVGLGNIGEKYEHTRHNIGFKIVDYFCSKEKINFVNEKLAFKAEYNLKGRKFIFIKPNTYMNLSGKAVKYWLQKENVPLENLLIITDDLNLPFGHFRVKGKGSDGGHNGLKDIQEKINTSIYNRLRFGISAAFSKGKQVDYVLGEWSVEEKASLQERLDKCTEIIKSFVLSGVNNTMNTFNGK